jgi:hypothetical protein
MEKQREETREFQLSQADELISGGNRIGQGKARPNKEVLTLMTIRERMILAKRFGEIEAIERQIEKMQYDIIVK